MKTKFFSLFLMHAISIGTIFAGNMVGSLWYNFDTSTRTAEVTYRGTSYQQNKYSGDIIIPSSVTYEGTTYSVTSIGDEAFRKCPNMTSITIPKSVTRLGNYAFATCSGLTSITIPNSVTSLGNYAFAGCSGLTSITIPNSVTSLGNYAFAGCSGFTSFTFPNSFTSTGDYTLANCKGLTSVIIPNNITTIGNGVFSSCTGLTSMTIGNGVTSIGNYAFQNCSGLTSVTMGHSVTSIGNYAFNGCTGLTSFTVTNSVTSIGEEAFSNCTGLTSVTIGNGVTSIGKKAFQGCSHMTSVTMGNSVTRIESNAFYNCTALTSVHISNIASWCDISFISNYANPLYYARKFYVNGNLITDLIIPEGVKSIRQSAFIRCYGLRSVTIPNSVTSIGYDAFKDCYGLTSLTIPNSVLTIGSEAFRGCTGFTSVTIPNSVKNIGYEAFIGCSGLTFITMEAITPPKLSTSRPFPFPASIPIYVPCGTLDAYLDAWGAYSNDMQYLSIPYVIYATEYYEHGWVELSDYSTICDGMPVLTATPDYGYHFVQWNDGNTDNPRTIELTQDTTITASFAINTYLVRFFGFNNVLLDSQSVEHGTSAVAPKAPNIDHYDFVGWDKAFLNITSPLDVFAIYKQNTVDVKNVNIDSLPRKVINDGQILILRGDRTYTVTGQELR